MDINRDSLIQDEVGTDMVAIFQSGILTDSHPGEDQTRVAQGFRSNTDGSWHVQSAYKYLFMLTMLLFVIMFLLEIIRPFQPGAPSTAVKLPVAPVKSRDPRNSSEIRVADVAPDLWPRHVPMEQAPAAPALAQPSMSGTLVKSNPISHKSRKGNEPRPRQAASFARDGMKVRQSEKQVTVAPNLAQADGDCASWPAGSDEMQICWREMLMQAHDRLVTSYNDAVSAGVPRRQLVHFRNQWLSARRRSRVDPAQTIRGYGKVSGSLQEAARLAQLANDEAKDR